MNVSQLNKKKLEELKTTHPDIALDQTVMKHDQKERTKMMKKEHRPLHDWEKKFAMAYSSHDEYFGDGTAAYLASHPDLDPLDKKARTKAMTRAKSYLQDPAILLEIDKQLNLNGFNDQNIDKETLFIIQQKADLPSKISAIKEYNKLRGRIVEKQHVDSDITINLKNYAPTKNTD